jgi:uncharacterized protein YoaH (UPF0181 family)
MRSDQIHRALARGISRYEVCQLVAKGVRVMHKPGTRYEDSINDVLGHLNSEARPLILERKPGLDPAA